MADTLIVYYSLEGNVDFVARELAKSLGAETCRLETVQEYPRAGILKFFHGGKDAVMGYKPALKGALPDTAAYQRVVIGTPVWAGRPAAPINTFLAGAALSGKQVAVFASSAGGNAEKCLAAITAAAEKQGATVTATASFVNPLKKRDEALASIAAFAAKIRA